MTLEEDLARHNKAVAQWELAVKLYLTSKAPPELLETAKRGLQRCIDARNRVLYKIQEETAHQELTHLPWLGEDL